MNALIVRRWEELEWEEFKGEELKVEDHNGEELNGGGAYKSCRECPYVNTLDILTCYSSTPMREIPTLSQVVAFHLARAILVIHLGNCKKLSPIIAWGFPVGIYL